MPKPELLECFDNPAPNRPYLIEHVAEEFTSVCPKTGHPDFGVVTLRYVPAGRCVELKAFKLYLQSFRSEGIFYEAVTSRIADDLIAAMDPRWLQLMTQWRGRGGIRSNITVEHGVYPAGAPGAAGPAPTDDDEDPFPGDDDEGQRLRPGEDDDDAPPPGFDDR